MSDDDGTAKKHAEISDKAIENVFRKRSGIKSSITKRMSQIEQYIRDGHSSVELSVKGDQLSAKYLEAKEVHEKLLNLIEPNDPRCEYLWLEDIEFLIDESLCAIQVYISDNKKENETSAIDSKMREESSRERPEENLWKNLKKISLPIFSGDKRQYENWAAAFSACIDKAPIAEEHKLLQLRQYLAGEAALVIDGLGHSATAYEVAKEKLERKYGGERRRTALYLEEVDRFKVIRADNYSDLEKFADLLDVLTINLKETKRTQELGSGLLYIKLQQKLPKAMLTAYHRWLFEKGETGSVLSLRTWILQENEFENIAEETAMGIICGKKAQGTFTSQIRSSRKTEINCKICHRQHEIVDCPKLLAMDTEQRYDMIYKLRLCYGCFKDGHTKQYCQQYIKCDQCGANHHTLFHRDLDPTSLHSNSSQVQNELISTSVISLRTIPVRISHGGKEILINALLDDGSTQTFINSDIADFLRLPRENQTDLTVSVLNGTTESFMSSSVNFEIASMDRRRAFKISAMTTDRVTGDMQPVNWQYQAKQFNHLKKLPFWKPNKGKIDILIGLDHAYLHQNIKEVFGGNNDPFARLTPLGWTCIGRTGLKSKCMPNTRFVNTYFHSNNREFQQLDEHLKRFWEIEEVDKVDRDYMSVEDNEIMASMNNSIVRSDKTKRYQVPIPWKSNKEALTSNYPMALQRLRNTEKQLSRKENVKIEYIKVIEAYKEKGYIRKIEKEANGFAWYLPHFPVVNLNKSTTKIRIVFDASAPYNGLSLNETMNRGPKLHADLAEIITRFRMNKIAIICDISEMYLQIRLRSEDKIFHRFLWRNVETEREPDIYEFDRVIFGGTASPFLAQFVSRYNAEKYRHKYPRAAETVLESTYMDDSMDSVNIVEEAKKLYSDLTALWGEAGMKTHKWLSNSTDVMNHIPVEERAKYCSIGEDKNMPTKTLGIAWNHHTDQFIFEVEKTEEIVYTKRNFLRKVAAIFDPLGFLSPYILAAKLLIQEMWVCQVDWDSPIDGRMKNDMEKWLEDLCQLSELKIPRCLSYPLSKSSVFSLHIFTDASEEAYAALVYVRSRSMDNRTSCQLVASKSKVAPLTAMSIPRLELLAAVKGSEMAQKFSKTFHCTAKDIVLWTDSCDVLGWIGSRSRIFKPFVAHKIGKIHSCTEPGQWRFVPSKLNPADIATHQSGMTSLANNEVWLNGPTFLSKSEEEWPYNENFKNNKLKEVKKGMQPTPAESQVVKLDTNMGELFNNECCGSRNIQFPDLEYQKGGISVLNTRIIDDHLKPERFSSLIRFLRVKAWVYRFIYNCKSLKENRSGGELSVDEVNDMQTNVIREAQIQSFTTEYNSLLKGKPLMGNCKILALSPRMDEDKIIRCDSRIIQAECIPYDTKFPIILPRSHPTTKLIVSYYHKLADHQGTNLTLSKLSARYWVIAAREEIRECEQGCYECRRRKAKAMTQIMAPLPPRRVTDTLRAFANIGVDFGGPFLVKQGRGKVRQKRYLCLFTCLSTRAVHLEMAYSLDTDSFLNAFWRMTYRRGEPKHITSDNGTNFVGAEKELKVILGSLDQEKIKRQTTHSGISWHFNPPYSPHTGGVFEVMIKAAKRAMRKLLGNADITDEELITVMTGAEALINSRPLTYQTANASDIIPLTPNHFLFGQIGGDFAPDIDNAYKHPMKRWMRVQDIIKQFWRRWIREWLPSLNPRSKWRKLQRNISVGDVVLVLSQKSERGRWPLGKVLEAVKGNDGNVRAVKLLVEGKTIERGLNSLSLIAPADEFPNNNYLLI